jgi:cyclophilin family peptidyl-prolyl cis-trans isomerase
MNFIIKNTLAIYLLLILISCTNSEDNKNTIVSIKTTLGEIKIKLYDETPIHRDNFIRLVNTGIYKDESFHRVIRDFMIQTGDPDTKTTPVKNMSDTIKTYTIPSEFCNLYYHKKGAVAAARQGNEVNPDMRSSGTQFYIVQGTKKTDDELNIAENRINSSIKQNMFNKYLKQTTDSLRLAGVTMSAGQIQEIASVKMFQYLTTIKEYKFSEEQKNIYKSIGGTPILDGTYTVFGEVIEGLDVVDRIASVSTDSKDKPLTDIKIIKIKIEK